MIDYSPLWKTMERKGITQYRLLKLGIDHKTLDSLKKSKNITLLTVEKLVNALECTPNDVFTFRPDPQESKQSNHESIPPNMQ